VADGIWAQQRDSYKFRHWVLLVVSFKQVLAYVTRKVKEFQDAPQQNLRTIIKPNWRARTDVLRSPGVYVIYSEGKTIYVGMAGKGKHTLNYRIGNLFSYSAKGNRRFHHTLTKKLLTKFRIFGTIDDVRKFYQSCKLKTVETETFQQARTLEAVLIELLKPKYND